MWECLFVQVCVHMHVCVYGEVHCRLYNIMWECLFVQVCVYMRVCVCVCVHACAVCMVHRISYVYVTNHLPTATSVKLLSIGSYSPLIIRHS